MPDLQCRPAAPPSHSMARGLVPSAQVHVQAAPNVHLRPDGPFFFLLFAKYLTHCGTKARTQAKSLEAFCTAADRPSTYNGWWICALSRAPIRGRSSACPLPPWSSSGVLRGAEYGLRAQLEGHPNGETLPGCGRSGHMPGRTMETTTRTDCQVLNFQTAQPSSLWRRAAA